MFLPKVTAFGKEIKKRLIDKDKNQNWLIKQVGERTGLYFDDSYLYKIITGRNSPQKIVQSICEILDLSYPAVDELLCEEKTAHKDG